MAANIFSAIVQLALGLIFGAVMTFGHSASAELFGVVLPWGLVLACLGVAGVLIGTRLLTHSRSTTIWIAAGIVTAVVVLAMPGPGGSILITNGWVGTTWVLAPTFIALMVILWPDTRPRQNASATVPVID